MQATDLLKDPHWFPVHFDFGQDTLTFLKTTRDALSKGSFLDQRFFLPDDRFQAVRLSQALQAHIPRQPISWIFHSAYCASTLMARALDVNGKTLALKEPDILMQLSNAFRMARRANLDTRDIERVRNLIFALLSRRFSPDERIIIKPANPANYLLQDVLSCGEKALLMTSDLETFLTSVLRKGGDGTSFMRVLYNIYTLDGTGLSKISERDALRFTDLQVAAIIWQHQHEDLTAAAKIYPDQTRAINGLAFLPDRLKYMRAASDFLSMNLTDRDLETNVNGPVFTRNAKFSDQTFDNAEREAQNARLQETFADRLKSTIDWQSKLDLGRGYTYLPAKPLL
ncbi:MAG: hypothetical protein AAGJ85_05225 [Pseudomonadota bacterium]